MLRDGRILYEEEFQIVAGEDTVLVAWEQYSDWRDPGTATIGSTEQGRLQFVPLKATFA